MTNLLLHKIADPTKPVILYELTPPAGSADQQSIDAYATCAVELFQSLDFKIDAVNIPEIRSENSHGPGEQFADFYVPKMNTQQFAKLIRDLSREHFDVILNRCTVYEPLEQQIEWLNDSVQNHNIRSFILVGGESSAVKYPGPSVIKMSQYIQDEYTDRLLCGGIVIQTRRHQDSQKDEPYRLIEKIKSGLEFFTSQVIFDSKSIISLLQAYSDTAKKMGVQPKRIFLSFAPVCTRKNMEFLRWLGVVIPESVEKKLFETGIGVGWRSVKISVNIMQEVLDYIADNDINVPIGLNIEHINRSNFELTKELITQLAKVYYEYYAQKVVNL